jgi:enhancer of yellow 2 transcription factor
LKKSLIEKKLEESGEKARLEEYLRQKLIECGWKDELKKYCLGMHLTFI